MKSKFGRWPSFTLRRHHSEAGNVRLVENTEEGKAFVTDQVKYALERMQTDEGYFTYGALVWDALDSGQREVLKQLLFQGPVWDGNVPCKRARDDLIEFGLATRCCFLGDQGYTAATCIAHSVFRQGRGDPLPKKRGTPG